jgi:hypothetical protein
MTEPLGETPEFHTKEFFTKAAVERFKKRRDDIERCNLRHYNQIVTQFDGSAILSALSKFQIPIKTRVTVYGGFTGQFAESLMKIGMMVVFTDPMAEWVDRSS